MPYKMYFTFCKNKMTRILALTILSLLISCEAFAFQIAFAANDNSLNEAKRYFQAGETYQAKKRINAYLKSNPKNYEAQKLMAQILDQEIAQHKEAFQGQAPEEVPADRNEQEIKTWLERGRALLEAGEYDEAALAVENVFRYDPKNEEASRLMDIIRGNAWKDGKKEILSNNRLVEEEVTDRVSIYKRQARKWLEQGKPGAARLAVEKVLLLSPEDKESLQMLQQIKQNAFRQKETKPAFAEAQEPNETGKTL